MVKKYSFFVLCILALSPSNLLSKTFTLEKKSSLETNGSPILFITPFRGSVTLQTHDKKSIDILEIYESSSQEDLEKIQTECFKNTQEYQEVFFISALNEKNPSSCSISYVITVPVSTMRSVVLKDFCTKLIVNSKLIEVTETQQFYGFAIKE